MAKHDWTEADDIAAFYVYRFGTERLGNTITEVDVARSCDIGLDSFRMRIRNFRALDGKGGLVNWAAQSQEVYRRYQLADEETLRRLFIETRSKPL